MISNSILIGNGFNQCENKDKSWNEILKTATVNLESVVDKKLIDSGKYTYFYESILALTKTNDLKNESNLKSNIASELLNMKRSKLYNQLINIPTINNIMTTNYDNCIEQELLATSHSKIKNLDSKENLYSIRRKDIFFLNDKKRDGKEVQVWNIHGSIEKPSSIMLGYDHYCGSIGKIDSYIKGYYKVGDIKTDKLVDKIENNVYDGISWIELFFNSNIHIIGFGLDFNELDLWWLLIRRSRLIKNGNKIKNTIYFYSDVEDNFDIKDDSDIKDNFDVENKNKIKFLKSYGVVYKKVKIECDPSSDDYYKLLNQKVMDKIKSTIELENTVK